ncbi:MAG: chromosomal replication initiator protein DnaA [Clostridia bacterium]|nr:chromosomal replication initiator protein DnaA [Clostridia bacterium]
MPHFDDLSSVWSVILEYIAEKFSKLEFNLWFKDLRLAYLDEEQAVLLTDSEMKRDSINARFGERLSALFSDVLGIPVKATVYYDKDGSFDLSTILGGEPEVEEEIAPAAPVSEPTFQPREFNQEYTFANFIVGSSNKFVYAAATAVANNPSGSYNPLFIYGPSGLGKTHLMYAVTNELKKKNPNIKILYVKGEEFTNQLVDSISKKNTNQFREKYRKADVLLIDDIQFIAGKEATQEEFFHTFNALHEEHKQIILSSDRPPHEIKTLEDRLKSRFEWGLIADIQPPDFELRLAILKSKAEQAGLDIPKEALTYIADNIQSNIRQLEGVIKKLGAMHLLSGTPITFEVAQRTVDEIGGIKQVSDEEKMDRIIATVAKKYGISTSDIMGTKRNKEISFPRHVAIYIARKTTGLSLPQIGKFFSRDHSTILSSINAIETELKRNQNLEFELKELTKEATP